MRRLLVVGARALSATGSELKMSQKRCAPPKSYTRPRRKSGLNPAQPAHENRIENCMATVVGNAPAILLFLDSSPRPRRGWRLSLKGLASSIFLRRTFLRIAILTDRPFTSPIMLLTFRDPFTSHRYRLVFLAVGFFAPVEYFK